VGSLPFVELEAPLVVIKLGVGRFLLTSLFVDGSALNDFLLVALEL
jgi:hypothetical protein